jgi:hypothetical protein
MIAAAISIAMMVGSLVLLKREFGRPIVPYSEGFD